MSGHQAMSDLAARFFAAIEAGDIEGVTACYAPHAVIWHNDDGVEQSREENLKTLRSFIGFTADRTYADARRSFFDGGFAQQHRLVAHAKNGAALESHVAILCRVEDGVIVRLDEYMDPAPIQAWIKRGLEKG
jgi:ketosteroid isomerase-like protein